MKTKNNILSLDGMLRRLHWTTRHQRLNLFSTATLIGLLLPWLPSCETTVRKACTVNSIYDGDTLRLTCSGERIQVRLYCIDAPEMGQQPWGKESRDYLRAITPGEVIILGRTKDRYGRTVGEVITDDEDQENLNLAMVWSGRAAVYPKYCNDRHYFQAEGEARKIGAGVWARQGLHQTPWQHRAK